MKTGRAPSSSSSRGIALVIVMIVLTVLTVLAGGFAFSMKVETRLASNASREPAMDWLGRSGVELARYVLGMQALLTPGYDALNQKWAGGSGETNEILAAITLENNQLGEGSYSIHMVDLDRRININIASDELLQQALQTLGADPREAGGIVESIRDWIDEDDHPHLVGAESDDYLSNPNQGFMPYFAKNGPIDDLTELLLVRGVTPELFWGGANIGAAGAGLRASGGRALGWQQSVAPLVGLTGVFTPISGPTVNINTVSMEVLLCIPGVDPDVAAAIIQARAGPDGVDGTEDDMPFRNIGELINVPGVSRQMMTQFQRLFNVRSTTFEVRVEAQIGGVRRVYVALLRRVNNRDIQILHMHPE